MMPRWMYGDLFMVLIKRKLYQHGDWVDVDKEPSIFVEINEKELNLLGARSHYFFVLVGNGITQKILSGAAWLIDPDPKRKIERADFTYINDGVRNGLFASRPMVCVKLVEILQDNSNGRVEGVQWNGVFDKKEGVDHSNVYNDIRSLILTCPGFGIPEEAMHLQYMPGGSGFAESEGRFRKLAKTSS